MELRDQTAGLCFTRSAFKGMLLGGGNPRRLIERTQDAGNVAHRTGFSPAPRQRFQRFAFKIDENKITSRNENLPEMKVTMYSRFGQAFTTSIYPSDAARRWLRECRQNPRDFVKLAAQLR